eukprot:SAG31_NODE_26915_length_434_cov_0.859701_1_plen_30_part_01
MAEALKVEDLVRELNGKLADDEECCRRSGI